MEHYF